MSVDAPATGALGTSSQGRQAGPKAEREPGAAGGGGGTDPPARPSGGGAHRPDHFVVGFVGALGVLSA